MRVWLVPLLSLALVAAALAEEQPPLARDAVSSISELYCRDLI